MEEKSEKEEGILEKLRSIVPESAGLTKVEYEGPDVVIYVNKIEEMYKDESIVKNISSSLKKKILVRSDPSKLMPVEEALSKILEIVPKESGVSQENIKFSPEFCEVTIEAVKPGLVIGKKGSTLIKIISETHWSPKVIRLPTINSDILRGVRQLLINEGGERKKFLNNVGKKVNRVLLKSEWLKVTALGGFKEVGRSCLLVETNQSKILLDCGISPEPGIKGADAASEGENRAYPYLDEANITIDDIDAVVLSHAHMDHVGFLPYLFEFGYDGPVYCTPPTRDLATLLYYDYIGLVQKSGGTPLYREKDMKKTITHMITRDYGEVTNITDEIKMTFHNAGHILGSSITHLHIGEGLHNIVYTGDIQYGFTRLFEQADVRYPRIDSLFIESTYGGSRDIAQSRQQAEKELMDTIKQTLSNNGKVLIPVFAVGRSQEIMLVLETYFSSPEYKLEVPVFLDGMVLEASAIHTAYPEYLKSSVRHRILSNNSPFESEIFEVAKGSREEVLEQGPSIILASSGMLNGGPSLEYFKAMAEDPKNTLIFVGYNSVTSIGRRVQNGAKELALPDDDGKLKPININMQVKTIEGFSGHSDQRRLLEFIRGIRATPKRVFTMHGEEYKCEELARTIASRMHIETRAPMDLDSIRLR
ncbi:MAG: beta-CASP ribonuclease aCPSF1 [Candidatus Micrarchaeaceae archaeon]